MWGVQVDLQGGAVQGGVCTNNSQVTSVVSGTSCGPVWGDTTTALVMVKQPLQASVLPGEQRANSTIQWALGTSFPLSGQDLRCDQKQMTWSSDPSWKRLAEPPWGAGPSVTTASVIFFRSFGYSCLIGKSLTVKCPLHKISVMTYYTVKSKGSSPLPLK